MVAASLHPVPRRPSGPVDQAAAERHVSAALPGLDEQAARALAIVALAGRSRADAASELELDHPRLADTLARGRKSLRRSLFPLPGSGWCERAERLISDRLDGALEGPGAARLEVHLRNCPRCVEHERRLVQVTDNLTDSFERAHGSPAPAAERATLSPTLAVVRPSTGPRPLPFGQPVRPAFPAAAEQPRTAAPAPDRANVMASVRGIGARAPASVIWAALLILAVLLVVAGVALAVAGALDVSIH